MDHAVDLRSREAHLSATDHVEEEGKDCSMSSLQFSRRVLGK
jgi:hypothetical protein